MRRRAMAWCLRGLAALVSIAVAGVILELFLIFLEPLLSRGFFVFDPDLGFRVRSYADRSNRFGFNDQDYSLEKPDGTYRILVLSDSFNWASGPEENYTALLERMLAERYGQGTIEVINAGYPMTHTGEQLEALRKFGLRYDPDLVVLGFFAGNDFFDADPHRKRIVVNDVYFDVDRRRERTLFGYPLVAQSRLLSYVRQNWKVAIELWKADSVSQRSSDRHRANDAPSFDVETFVRIERARLEFCNLRVQEAGTFDPHISFILDRLTKMQDLLVSRGIDFAVAIYPDEFQVNPDLTSFLFERHRLDPEAFDLRYPQKLLERHLEEAGVSYVDLTEPMSRHPRARSLYIPRNTHWSAEGERVAAEVIHDFLVARAADLEIPPARSETN